MVADWDVATLVVADWEVATWEAGVVGEAQAVRVGPMAKKEAALLESIQGPKGTPSQSSSRGQ